jgi:hypothetical protein
VTAGELAPSSAPTGSTKPAPTTELRSGNEWHPEVLDGPLSTRALLRVDEALRLADSATGLTFSVYIGELTEPVREHAERLHAELGNSASVVLIAISPNQRLLEIVTGADARRRILDRDAKLAALSMAAAFTGGDPERRA